MATSESDDFESADEELNVQTKHTNKSKKYASIGSDSDDDVEYIPVHCHASLRGSNKDHKTLSQQKHSSVGKINDKSAKIYMEVNSISDTNDVFEKNIASAKNKKELVNTKVNNKIILECENDFCKSDNKVNDKKSFEEKTMVISRRERPQKQHKVIEVELLGAKKLGTIKFDKLSEIDITNEVKNIKIKENQSPLLIQKCLEELHENNLQEEFKDTELQNILKQNLRKEEAVNIPAELMSNLKFKEIFKPHGWKDLENNVDFSENLLDDKYHPVLDKLASTGIQQSSTNRSWNKWGTWGVNSLFNTATVGVSTLTNHVSHGLSILEESMGVPDPANLITSEIFLQKNINSNEKKNKDFKENQSQPLSSTFGFSNFISNMSSITKLVESTSTKVISGGLDTLETIGKKTMEVLQEGDPGLKKKRAFFLNDIDKPILSQILREAKEKADFAKKSLEEKQLARKVHFESLFDDYQGLMHLEALEILSKQCSMKIQQQIVNLSGNDLTSMQETLDEIKDLCDLGEEDDEDDDQHEKDFQQKLEEACKDLDISIKYDKLIDVWNEINLEITQQKHFKNISYREIFQKAISTLAEFTAYSVERFHKTAECLLIKEHRSTVNETDCLVQLTKILSYQIGFVANIYCYRLNNDFKNDPSKSEIDSALKTIALETTNASSYIHEALRLLIPILQVGAM